MLETCYHRETPLYWHSPAPTLSQYGGWKHMIVLKTRGWALYFERKKICIPFLSNTETQRMYCPAPLSFSDTRNQPLHSSLSHLASPQARMNAHKDVVFTVSGQTWCYQTLPCPNQWLALQQINKTWRLEPKQSWKNTPEKKKKKKKCMRSDRLQFWCNLIQEWPPACLYDECMCGVFLAAEPNVISSEQFVCFYVCYYNAMEESQVECF